MGDALKRAGATTVLWPTGPSGGGCISPGRSCNTGRAGGSQMFLGEMASLEAILKTQTVRVPKPIKVVELPGDNTVEVMEHLEMKSLHRKTHCLELWLADLHLHNQQLREMMKKRSAVELTSATVVLEVNNWQSDWVSFFARQRIQPQMDLIERSSRDREVKIPSFFCGVEIIPSLLHGDLWGGNVAEDDSSHSEYDLAIAGMFGGFNSSFYSAYHSKISRAAGFEKHLKLYQLFHYMNQWNHLAFCKHYEKPCKISKPPETRDP
ncbi:hypothetical protein EK904_009318 [Melospiza melodia maxima]|nr:hypothetical protein EK904_009318 [Melospiza melodia maxima]